MSLTQKLGKRGRFAKVPEERAAMDDLSKISGIKATETFVYLDAINKWVEMC